MPKIYEAPFYTEQQVEEMEEKDMLFPYSTKYMKYDGLKRQYIPTLELLRKHGVDIEEFLEATDSNSALSIQNELEYISDQIYNFIDKSSGSNLETLKFLVAKGIKLGIAPFRFRAMFEEILWKQARFYVANDDVTKSTGLDIEQKQWINKGVLNNENRHIDPKVKTMLLDLGLTWTGSYDMQFIFMLNRKDW